MWRLSSQPRLLLPRSSARRRVIIFDVYPSASAGQALQTFGHRTRAHGALVNVKRTGGVLFEHFFAHPKARAHCKKDLLGEPTPNEVDTAEHRFATPEAQHFEVDLLAATRKDQIGNTEAGAREDRAPPGSRSPSTRSQVLRTPSPIRRSRRATKAPSPSLLSRPSALRLRPRCGK